MVETQTRTVAHVFANYRDEVERGGKTRTIARSAKRGQQVTLSAAEAERLDSLGALVPKGEDGADLFNPHTAAAELRDRILSAATTRAEGLAAALPAQLTVSPPSLGVAPVGDVVTGDTGGDPVQPPGVVTPLSGVGDAVSIDVAEAGPGQIADHIRDEKLNASDTVALAGDDPALAAKVLEAEQLAHGGDARSTVVGPLEKIAG